MTTTRAAFGLGLVTCMMSACAAGPPPAKSAPSAQDAAPASAAAPVQPEGPPGAYPQQSYAQPPPSPGATAPQEPSTAPKPATPAGAGMPASPGRAAAIQSAAREVESSLRELDVAAGDCHNACRALGSMDRAAGRLCGLAQETDDHRRCEGAKEKLYSARDRVRTTCGSCPGGASVDRSAPVPSIR